MRCVGHVLQMEEASRGGGAATGKKVAYNANKSKKNEAKSKKGEDSDDDDDLDLNFGGDDEEDR